MRHSTTHATRLSTFLTFGLPLLLGAGLVSCSDDTPDQDNPETQGIAPRTEPLPFRMTQTGAPELPEAPPELRSDTTLLKAPDDGLAIVAVKSGHVMQVYKGDRSGTKETYFKDYGRYQRVEDSSAPKKSNDPVPPQNVLMISTPVFFGSYQAEHGQGWRAPNRFEEEFEKSGKSDSMSISQYSLEKMNAKRLPDTTINGYPTRVYRVDAGAIVHTLWIWRDVALREHFFAPYDDIEYWIEPVSVEIGIDVPDSLFEFPKDYVILDRQGPPIPSALPPPPVPGAQGR